MRDAESGGGESEDVIRKIKFNLINKSIKYFFGAYFFNANLNLILIEWI